MAFGLSNKDKELVKGVLLSATHKMIKQLQLGKIISPLDFYNLCEKSSKERVFLGTVTALKYKYDNFSSFDVKIKYDYLGAKFKITFFMAEPHGKFEDRTLIAYNLNVNEVTKRR